MTSYPGNETLETFHHHFTLEQKRSLGESHIKAMYSLVEEAYEHV